MTNLPNEEEKECFHQIVRTLPSMLSALLQHKQHHQQQQGEEEQEQNNDVNKRKGMIKINSSLSISSSPHSFHHTSRTVALVSQLHRMLDIAVQLLISPETDRIEFERASILLNQDSGTFFDILRRILLIHIHERERFSNPVILSIPDVQLECLQLLLRLFSDAFQSIRSVKFMQYLKTITQPMHLAELVMKHLPGSSREAKEKEETITPNACIAVELFTLLVQQRYVDREFLLGNCIVKLTGLCCLQHPRIQTCGVYIFEHLLLVQQQQGEEKGEELTEREVLNLIQRHLEIKLSGWMIKEAWLNLVTALSSSTFSLHQLHIITSLLLLFLPKMLYQYKEAMCESITLLIGSLLKIVTDAYSLSLLQTYFPSAWIANAGVDETISPVFSHQHTLSPLFLLRQLLQHNVDLINCISMNPIIEVLLYRNSKEEKYLLFVMIQLWMHCGRGAELLFVLSMEESLRRKLYHIIETSQNTHMAAVVALLLCIGRDSACVASRELRDVLFLSIHGHYSLGFRYLQILLDSLSVCDVRDNANNTVSNDVVVNPVLLSFSPLDMYDLDGSLVNDVLFVDLLYPTAWEELSVLQEASTALLQPLEKRPKTSRLLELRTSLGIARYNYSSNNHNYNYNSYSCISHTCRDYVRNDSIEGGLVQWRRHQMLTAALCCVLFMPYLPTAGE